MSRPLLELDEVELCYDRRVVVSGANLQVQRGRWIALVGPNASGKTTLLRCAAGRLQPARGAVRFEGRPLYPLPDRGAAMPGHAVAPEELPPFLTLRQSLEIYASAHGLAAVPEHSTTLCRLLGLAPFEGTLIRSLSLGTRQKLAVVLALLAGPSVLLLDEVFNGLDVRSALALKHHLQQRVREHGLSIVLATHALDVVREYCDELVLIDSGRLVQRWHTEQLRGFTSTAQLEQALAAALPAVPGAS